MTLEEKRETAFRSWNQAQLAIDRMNDASLLPDGLTALDAEEMAKLERYRARYLEDYRKADDAIKAIKDAAFAAAVRKSNAEQSENYARYEEKFGKSF